MTGRKNREPHAGDKRRGAIRGMTSPSLVTHRAAQVEGKWGPVLAGEDVTRYSPRCRALRQDPAKLQPRSPALPLDTRRPKPRANPRMRKMTSERGG